MTLTLISPQQNLGSSDPSIVPVYVVGSSAQVTSGTATHTWATLAALNGATGPEVDAKVLVLESAGALTANITFGANNLIIKSESRAAPISLGIFTFTLSGSNCFLDTGFTSTAGLVVVSGRKNLIVAFNTSYALFVNSNFGNIIQCIGLNSALLLTNTDALTGWAKRFNTLGNNTLNGVAWNGSVFCTVGNSDGSNSLIATSPDGTTWTKRTNTLGNVALKAVVWNGAVFCAVGVDDGSNSLIATSPDGTTWTKRTNTLGVLSLLSIAWNGAVFCAVGANDGANPLIATSPDGTTWTKRTNTLGNSGIGDLRGIAWNGAVFAAAGASEGVNALIATSPDGGSGAYMPSLGTRLYAARLYQQGLAATAVLKTVLAVQPEVQPAGVNQADFFLMRGPYCKRTASASPTPNGTQQKISFDTNVFDTNSNWDNTNFRFVPTIPGLYKVFLQVLWSTIASGATITSHIRKNGTIAAQAQFTVTLTDMVLMSHNCEDRIDCNGIGDYIDFAITAPTGCVMDHNPINVYCLIERLP